MKVNLHLYSYKAGRTDDEAVPLECTEEWSRENLVLWRSVPLVFKGKVDYFEILDHGISADNQEHYVIGRTYEAIASGYYGFIQ